MAISLLPPDLKKTRKIGITDVYRLFTITLVIYVISALLVGSVVFLLKRRNDQIRLLYDSSVLRINELARVESADIIVKDRLKNVRGQTAIVPNFKTTFELVYDITSRDLELEILEVSSDPQRIRMKVRGVDSFAIERFLENAKVKFSGLTFDSLTFEEDKYVVDLVIPLKQ